jgi:glycosyltransferase involved in cell wall biosynthesis
VIATGTPIITRDSDAIRDLLDPREPGVFLVPPADPQALAEAIRAVSRQRERLAQLRLHSRLRERLSPRSIAAEVLNMIEALGLARPSGR